jgi:polyhydroxyalkanoate synthase
MSNTDSDNKLLKNFAQLGEQSWHLLNQSLQNRTGGDDFSIPDKSVVADAFARLTGQLLADPARLLQAQMTFQQDLQKLWQTTTQRLQGETATAEPVIRPEPGDRRFSNERWNDDAWFDYIKQYYLLAARSILDTVRATPGLDEKTAQKVDFYTRQYLHAMAPSNFAWSNPQVLAETLQSDGENLRKGLQNLQKDLEKSGNGELRIRMVDTEAFRLGENIAITPGKVVYQSALMQLIQYQPATETVYKRPLLIVPPWINKFYILDLRPKNSFIRWAVEQGFSVFVISWINPDAALAQKDFEDYLQEGTLAALEAIQQATGENDINAIGYCLGGTLLMGTLAYLSQKNNYPRNISNATLFTTLVDFEEAGELSVFVDEQQIALIEQQMEKRGYLEGSQMASVFNMLRPNDLIWSFYVNNYLLGKEPPAFDLLYWNSDSTRMPCKMHSFYMRNMYLYNKLREPGGISLLGENIDLRNIDVPLYFLSTREDHIAPWQGTYRGALLPKGRVKFVLGGSGHIAGVINPAGSKKYGYWTNPKLPGDSEAWLAGATQHEGSWWTDWLNWMKRRSGKKVPARTPGDGGLEVIEDAPGSYVKVRSGSS